MVIFCCIFRSFGLSIVCSGVVVGEGLRLYRGLFWWQIHLWLTLVFLDHGLRVGNPRLNPLLYFWLDEGTESAELWRMHSITLKTACWSSTCLFVLLYIWLTFYLYSTYCCTRVIIKHRDSVGKVTTISFTCHNVLTFFKLTSVYYNIPKSFSCYFQGSLTKKL